MGRIKTKTNAYGTTTTSSTFTYDGQGRLTSEIVGGKTITYGYDRRGNRTSKTENGVTTSYTYDKANKLLSETTGSKTLSYTYDARGNNTKITEGSKTVYRYYDSKNQLTQTNSLEETGVYTYYTYQPDGLRHSRQNSKEYISSMTHPLYEHGNNYVWAGDKLIGEALSYWQLIEPDIGYGGNYTPQEIMVSESKNYVYGQGLVSQYLQKDEGYVEVMYTEMGAVIGHQACIRQSVKTYDRATTNMLGDVVKLTRPYTGGWRSYDYSAFGDKVTQTGSYRNAYQDADNDPRIDPNSLMHFYSLQMDIDIKSSFGYRGEYKDRETGDIYLRARYYSPGIGRFTSQDSYWNPTNMIYGDNNVPSKSIIRQSGNLYSYCINDPVRYTDPSGLKLILIGRKKTFDISRLKLALFLLTGCEVKVNAGEVTLGKRGDKSYSKSIELVEAIINSDKIVTLYSASIDTNWTYPESKDSETHKKGKPADCYILYNPANNPYNEQKFEVNGEIAWLRKPNYISLGHELIHALGYIEGTIYFFNEEGAAIGLIGNNNRRITENEILLEHGYPQRVS